MNVGLFGGTFDPVHTGHLLLGEFLCDAAGLDKIWFMPALKPPHKDDRIISDIKHRLDMLEIATEDNQRFEVSRIEADAPESERSFTVNTLSELKDKHTDCRFYLIIGMDSLRDFHTWKDPDRIIELSDVLVMERPGYDLRDIQNGYENKVTFIDTPVIEISSTVIRNRAAAGKTIRYMVPLKVMDYIKKNNLYI